MISADVFTTLDVELKPDPSLTVIRLFSFAYLDALAKELTRIQDVATRVLALETETRDRMLSLLTNAMEPRHHNVNDLFLRVSMKWRASSRTFTLRPSMVGFCSGRTAARSMRSSLPLCLTQVS